MRWMNYGVSSLTPTLHRSASYPRSRLYCWPRITLWCKPTRWTNCDGSWLTWTKPPDCPSRLLWRPWWQTPREVTWTGRATAEVAAAHRRWLMVRHRPVLYHRLNHFVAGWWPSRVAVVPASPSPDYSISHRQEWARPATTLPTTANNPSTTIKPPSIWFPLLLLYTVSYYLIFYSAHLSANMTTKYLI